MESNLWTVVDNSSLIAAYKYDSEERTLDVEFKSNGAKYRYFGIPQILGESIKNQEHIGKFIKNKIIGLQLPYERIN